MASLQLVSFPLCPYVQRSVITLKRKGAPYELTFIDLENPPEWFQRVSPLGQVPVLMVDGKTPVFESAVINEYLDETVGKPLHPRDPLQKARERSWIEYGSGLLGLNYRMFRATTRAELDEVKKEFFDDLSRVESALGPGPFFRGTEFGLVDAAYAPLFMRVFFSRELESDPRWKPMPKVRAWAEALLQVPEVKESVVPDLAERYREYGKKLGSVLT